jgi:N,N'-diacetylchitobiose transport system permease protein
MAVVGESTASRVGVRAALIAFLVLMIFPVYWMVNTSFEPDHFIQTVNPTWFPFHATLAHFSDAIHKPLFWRYALNTVVASVATVVVSIAVALCAALALARFQFRGRRFFAVIIFVVQMVPQTALIIPLFLALRQANQLNRLPGLVAAYVAWVLPFCIWTLQGFVRAVPVDIEEAAMVDGCSRSKAFVKVVLPLITPGLVATSIFAFIQAWNQYLLPYVIMQDQHQYTLTVWLVSFSTNRGTDFGGLMAASALFTLPVFLLFLAVHRKMVSGLAAGAVKG